MIGFTQKTFKMGPKEILTFLIDYRQHFKNTIMHGKYKAQYFEHSSGDASASVFEEYSLEEENRSIRAYKTAMSLIEKMGKNEIAPTRFGLYSGKVIEANIENESFRFGNCFSAASRLRELCDYFDTPLLMDRKVAFSQKNDREYVTAIGKITPKSFEHPVHIFTIYKPGIHKIPINANKDKLAEFIKVKNQSIDCFHGNKTKNVKPNFSNARKKFYQASILFEEITGYSDLASKKILEFIEENSAPAVKFMAEGIKLENKDGRPSTKINLYRFGRELLRALDTDLYKNFVLETRWQKWFKFQWKKQGETIFQIGDKPNGVYFITNGKADVFNWGNKVIAQLNEGSVFGEMAYFTEEKVRNVTVVANTDLELYFISGEDFNKYPEIKNLFERIAKYRALNN
ncbi:MAG: cyclic nucleotide-binding domain-containing protein [Desulfobacteraceae bacterium]|nr:cyclic nucleotide-binding domain-containing protein [Desulfobacteraceae bacterium]